MVKREELYEKYPYLRRAFQYEEAWIKQYEDNYSQYLKDGIKVLEVGPGIGSFYFFLTKVITKFRYYGIDISEENCKICEERGVKNVMNADIINFLLSSSGDKFDLIVANDVLEHFKKEEAIRLVKLFYERLDENGIVIARVPNADYFLSNYHRYHDFTHEIIFTEESLSHLFSLGNFRNIEIRAFKIKPKSLIRKILRPLLIKFHELLILILEGEIHKNEMNLYIVAKK